MPDTTDARAEWIHRLWKIAIYFVVIGATIAVSTVLADWLHPR
jgi:hypothetical protein